MTRSKVSKPDPVIRPELNNSMDVATFKNFYWDKKELVSFCKSNRLPCAGGKIELAQSIEIFLRTGHIKESAGPIKRYGKLDSEELITRNTPVVNYKNDAQTKQFFLDVIGSKFHFNSYLRQFAKIPDMDGSLTYGDLVDGWLKYEADKKALKQKAPIDKQFQFNQFQRDFYASEKCKTRAQMLDAWKLVRSVPGQATYVHYLKLIKNKTSKKIGGGGTNL